MEAQFTIWCITQERIKYNYIVFSLSPKIATEVDDIILTLPVVNPYTTLKEQLIKCTSTLEQCHLQKLQQQLPA